jgi:hypothetical protein
MITTSGLRQPEPFAHDLVVVHDQAGDLGLAVGGLGFFRHCRQIVLPRQEGGHFRGRRSAVEVAR